MKEILRHNISHKADWTSGNRQSRKEFICRRIKLRCALTFLLSVIACLCFSQSKEIDSLQNILKEVPNLSPDERGTILIEIGNRLPDERALWYYDQALSILKDSTRIVRAICNKGGSLANLGRNEQIGELLLPIIPYAEKKQLNWYLDGVYETLALHYCFTGQYGLSIEYHKKSIEMGKLFPDKANFRLKYNDLGVLYYKLRANERALAMFKQALKVNRFGDKSAITIFGNIGMCYSELDSLDQALKYLNLGDSLCQQCRGSSILNLEFGYGMVYLKKKNYDLAKSYLKRALKRAIKANDRRMEADSWVYLARAYLATKELDSAKYVLSNAEVLAERNKLAEILLDVYRQSLILYTENLDKKSLATYQEKFILHKRAMYNSEFARDLAREETLMLERAHGDRIASQKAAIAGRTAVLNYQLLASRIGIAIVLLLLVFVSLVVHRLWRRRLIRSVLKRRVEERSELLLGNIHSAKSLCDQLDLQWAKLRQELDILGNLIPLKFNRYFEQRTELRRITELGEKEFEHVEFIPRDFQSARPVK